jgi:hypothetical protein
MLYRFLTFLFLIFCIKTSFAQHKIQGIWEGKFLASSALDLGQPKLVVEVFDVKGNGFFKGISHLYYEGNFYEHYKIIGMYDKKTSLIVFKEVETIAIELGKYGNCLGRYNTILKVEKGTMLQAGYWQPNIELCTYDANVYLQKKVPIPIATPTKPTVKPQTKKATTTADKPVNTLPKNNTTPVAIEPITTTKPTTLPKIKNITIAPPKKLTQRETDIQSLLEIANKDKDSIRVDVYDNGEIDGDSVSVYQDNQVQIDRKMITAKPITFYVSLSKANPISHLKLVAENLGTIPPCTALMIVTTKSKRYEVRLSSNFSKNATVELFLKE